jgi:phage shock protein A
VAAIKAENEALKAEVAELKSQVEALKAQPMAQSAHDVVTTTQTYEKTGDKGLDRLSKVLGK